ncbi:hypothetical protein ACT0L1_004352 [Vibrio vulnificus]|uniref:hypothetical protein n=1 Tax=Vibrio TaxID=662 RepID=UPI00235885EF|nr:hypothetical protein [Vibrio sp. CCUG 15886]MDC8111579.1 hypothetical protein [Vibrio sp. CCUG 15886]
MSNLAKMILVFTFSSFLLLFILFFPNLSDKLQLFAHVSTVVMVVIQLLAFFVIKKQLSMQKHLNVANFTLRAMEQLGEQKVLHEKLQNKHSTDITKAEVVAFLNIYESISSLIDTGVITFEDIDNAFAHRFFLACNHPRVHELELKPDASYYKAIYRLHKKWLNYRESRKIETFEDNSLRMYEFYETLAA